MLLYGLLHLSGFEDVTMDEIKNFRQWGSKTPGHPEFGHTAGVDATTGPLGQGISTATGFAQAERFLAPKYNRDGFPIFDHYTYVICGDGDLMEGVSAEAASYAGLQKLEKLIVLYDSNDINLDGETKDSFTEDVRARYNAYGWHTDLVTDGTDVDAIFVAIEKAKALVSHLLSKSRLLSVMVHQTNKVQMPFTVLRLVQKKQKQLVRHLIGTMVHLKFQLKSMRTLKLM